MTSRTLRWALPVLLGLGLLALAFARRPVPPPLSDTRFLMDTLVAVTVWGVEEPAAEELFQRAFSALEAVDREMARVEGSPLWELNRVGKGALLPATEQVVRSALAWARRTRGAFDPTMAPLIDLWDVLAGPHPPPGEVELHNALQGTGWEKIRLDPRSATIDLGGTTLDLGGIAKGFAIDRAAQALRDAGAADFIINAGGDLFVSGGKGEAPWRIGIQHPREADAFLRVVMPLAGALVTSGDYERGYEWQGTRVHHILDPRSGQPASGCRSVTVWAPTAIDADALATAVFVLGPEEGLALITAQPAAEALVVDAAGALRESPGFHSVALEAPRR